MRAFLFAASLVLIGCGAAQEPAPAQTAAASLEVRDAWAAPTPGGVDVSAGYVTIVNGAGRADRLVSASSPRASRVEIHEMAMDGAVMRMRRVEALEIPARGQVQLAPGGEHLMFFGVTEPFTEGETIEVRLTFANAGERTVRLPVRRGAVHGH